MLRTGFITCLLLLLAHALVADPAQDAYDAGRAAEAAALWQSAAEAGDAEAALKLAQMLDTGTGVPRDINAALDWYIRAADAGLPDAAFNVAAIFDQRGRPSEAAVFYARAAAKGHARAQFALGTLYELGEGVTRNHAVARYWYNEAAAEITRAAERGDALKATGAKEQIAPKPVAAHRTQGDITLVWDAGADTRGRKYTVSLFAPATGLIKRETAGSAIAIALPADAKKLRWRVARAGEPGATEWQTVPEPVKQPTVKIVIAANDAPALRLAEELRKAVASQAAVTMEIARDPIPTTQVVTGRPVSGGLSADIATFLPILTPDDVLSSQMLNHDIVVAIAGGVSQQPVIEKPSDTAQK